jgi:hypothetical protein
MKTFLILPLLLALNGCLIDDLNKGTGPLGIPVAGQGYDGPVTLLPGQEDAVMIVWKWTYGDGATSAAPPPVVWRSGDECTDDDGKHWNGSFYCPAHKHCCNGYYNVQSAVAYIETWGQPLSETSLAHELCHAWRFVEGDSTADGAHGSICFNGIVTSAASEGSLVYEANRRLKVVGL